MRQYIAVYVFHDCRGGLKQGLFKKAIQQGHRQGGGRGVPERTLRPPSNENALVAFFNSPSIDRI